MKNIVLILSLFIPLTLLAQTEVIAYAPGKTADAVTYFLPKTAIEVEVETTQVKYVPGEFSRYADRYLRLQDVSDKADEYWEISKIKVSPVGIPDPDHVYSIKLKDKSVAPLVELTSNGILVSINKQAPEEKAVAPIPAQEQKTRLNARDIMTEEILLANSTAKMAELTAKEIYNIRESKSAIIRGQADNMPKDGEAIKIVLANLEQQEEALMAMFTGVTQRETRTFVVRMVPSGNVDKDVLFRFSRKLGVLDKSNLGGSPVYFSLTNLNSLPAPDEKAKKTAKLDGVVYTVPGSAQVKIFNNVTTYLDASFAIAQFGAQETLGYSLFNKKNTTQVTFDTTTGGVLKIEQ